MNMHTPIAEDVSDAAGSGDTDEHVYQVTFAHGGEDAILTVRDFLRITTSILHDAMMHGVELDRDEVAALHRVQSRAMDMFDEIITRGGTLHL